MTPEGALKAQVLDFLKVAYPLHFRMQSGKVAVKRGFLHLAPEGTADVLVFKGTQPCWIELKAPKGKTHKERAEKQQAFRERVLREGHRHIQAQTLDEVIEFLR
jgi:hypothetical protein